MRRIALMLLAVLLLGTLVYAALSPIVPEKESANAKRIAELQTKQQTIVVEINDRQGIIQQQQNAIAGLQVEFHKCQGAIEELQRQDKEAADRAKKPEPTKK